MDANKSHIDQSTIYFTQTLNTSSYVGMGCCIWFVYNCGYDTDILFDLLLILVLGYKRTRCVLYSNVVIFNEYFKQIMYLSKQRQ